MVGTKYCMGGSTENCLDCSAFTQILLRDVYGINLPRTAQEQYNASAEVRNEELMEGDLVFSTLREEEIAALHMWAYIFRTTNLYMPLPVEG